MKTKLLALILLASGPSFAQVAVSVSLGPVVHPAPIAVVTPIPAPVVAYAPIRPVIGVTWVAGYWHPVEAGWAWHAGYWAGPPSPNAHWVAPGYNVGLYHPGYWHSVSTTTVAAGPGSYSRDTAVTGYNGRTATYQNNATWGNGSYTDTHAVTGPNGRTASSTTTASYAPGSTARETTVTGFSGKTATYQNDRTWGNGAYTDTRSYTGVNGATRTDTVSRSGGVVNNTFTGKNGNSRTFTHPARWR
jgi:hypothetical protein